MKDRIGTVVWSELQTTQIEKIKNLWSDILGYKWNSLPLQKTIDYHMATIRNKQVYGLVQLPHTIQKAGGNPFHLYFFAVANLKESKKRALSLGAKIIVDEISLKALGRWSILIDPLGAAFCIIEMEAKPMIPFASKAKCTFWWHELICKDPAKSSFFYSKLFDWNISELKVSPTETHYLSESKEGKLMRTSFRPMVPQLKEASIPDFWLGFLSVKDMDKACKKAIEQGATLLSETDKNTQGRYAWLSLPDKSLIGFIET